MADMMEFPKTVDEFMEEYKMVDTDHVYSNGTEYVPIFRMQQWFEHEKQRAPTLDAVPVVRCKDCKWSKPATNGKGQDGYGCTKDDNPAYEAFWWLTPDWFCADGKRRKEDTDNA